MLNFDNDDLDLENINPNLNPQPKITKTKKDGELKNFCISPMISNLTNSVNSIQILSPAQSPNRKSQPKLFDASLSPLTPKNARLNIEHPSPNRSPFQPQKLCFDLPPRAPKNPKKQTKAGLEKSVTFPIKSPQEHRLIEKSKSLLDAPNFISDSSVTDFTPLQTGRRNSIVERPKTDAPYGKIRRTMSLSADTTVMENIDRPSILPTERSSDYNSRRISAPTLFKLLRGEYNRYYERVIVVDCRFEYEYKGGHIIDALNINDKAVLEETFFINPPKGACIVFHCEFSSHRGPRMYQHLRERDRAVNQYPHLHFPEIYILDGGYKHFFHEYPEFCEPKQYIPMKDPIYGKEKDENVSKNQKQWNEKKRK